MVRFIATAPFIRLWAIRMQIKANYHQIKRPADEKCNPIAQISLQLPIKSIMVYNHRYITLETKSSRILPLTYVTKYDLT